MAKVQVTFRNGFNVGGSTVHCKPRVAETITSSGTSQATTITASVNEIAHITASGGAVFINYGAAPTAASGSGDLIPDGGSLQIGGLASGDKVAVIDVV